MYILHEHVYIYIIHICYMCFFDTAMHISTVLSNSSTTAPFGQPSNTAFSDILLTQPSQHSFPWTAFLRQSSWQVCQRSPSNTTLARQPPITAFGRQLSNGKLCIFVPSFFLCRTPASALLNKARIYVRCLRCFPDTLRLANMCVYILQNEKYLLYKYAAYIIVYSMYIYIYYYIYIYVCTICKIWYILYKMYIPCVYVNIYIYICIYF